MSLSGNLGFVSLDEVLRLLTRSDQNGSIEVSGAEIRGRIFVTKGGIGLATTSDDAGVHRHLVKSGLVDEEFLQSVEKGETTLAPIVEKSGGALTDLLREMTVESIYQLGLNGDAFEVQEGARTRYASPHTFELESLLGDAKQRFTDWNEVSKTVSDLRGVVRLTRDLGDREQVNIDRDAWRVLAEIGGGSSVVEIADDLGTTEFWAARVTARLIKDELVAFDGDEQSDEEPAAVPSEQDEEFWDTTPDELQSPEADTDLAVEEDDVHPDESWWEEPEDTEPSDTEEAGDQAVFADAEEQGQDTAEEEHRSIFGAFAPARGRQSGEEPVDETAEETSHSPTLTAEAEDVEEDTEAFLEKVFSELETSEEESDEEGYGLLRRRRMGAMRENTPDA